MYVLQVMPKRVCATVELDLEEIKHVLDVLDGSQVDYNAEKQPELHKSLEYVKKVFVPTMDRLLEEYKNVT
jgi:hypothetical protein